MTFVDFKKFFDCINKNSLFYKLQKCGITGNVYKIINQSILAITIVLKLNMDSQINLCHPLPSLHLP